MRLGGGLSSSLSDLRSSKYIKVARSSAYSSELVDNVARPIIDKHEECPDCVDRYFGMVWAKRLQDPNIMVRRRAHRSIRHLVATTCPLSTPCEKKHLDGQEVGGLERGKRDRASKRAKLTYRRSVQKAAAKMQDVVEQKHLQNSENKRAWPTVLFSYEINKPRGGGRKEATVAKKAKLTAWAHCLGKSKAHAVSGLSVYIGDCFHETTSADGSIAKRRREAFDEWKVLPEEERGKYQRKAVAENEALKELTGQNSSKFRASGSGRVLRKALRQRVQRSAAIRTLTDMQCDPVWKAGCGLCSYGSGLKPEFVSTESREKMAKLSEEIFGFDAEVKQNDWGGLRRFAPCAIRHAGLCSKDDFLQPASVATYNMYRILKQHNLHDKGPFVISVHIKTSIAPCRYYYLLRLFGCGEVCVLLPAVAYGVELLAF